LLFAYTITNAAQEEEENAVQTPEWLKPALYGALACAAALAVAGFSWGGWVTDGKAEQIASDRARLEVVAAFSTRLPRTIQPGGSRDHHHALRR
jgi:alpha/beta superfamily hydrolase